MECRFNIRRGPEARYTFDMFSDDSPEIEYYRAIEDLFSALRGVPHVLSPRDFQLVRSWWRDQVPLSAVRTGVAEVFARRRERGDPEPVVSLSYCRHAVEAHAKRAAEMAIGAPESSTEKSDNTERLLRQLSERLTRSADDFRAQRPRVAAVVDRISNEVLGAGDLGGSLLEEHLYALESSLLIDCFDALEDHERTEIETRATSEAEEMAANPDARARAFRALRDRLLRTVLDLPRLEVEG